MVSVVEPGVEVPGVDRGIEKTGYHEAVLVGYNCVGGPEECIDKEDSPTPPAFTSDDGGAE